MPSSKGRKTVVVPVNSPKSKRKKEDAEKGSQASKEKKWETRASIIQKWWRRTVAGARRKALEEQQILEEEARELFVKYDTDSDNFLDMEELGALLNTEMDIPMEAVERLFQKFDYNHDGICSFNEFRSHHNRIASSHGGKHAKMFQNAPKKPRRTATEQMRKQDKVRSPSTTLVTGEEESKIDELVRLYKETGKAPVMGAAENGDLESVKMLLSNGRFDVDEQDANGWTVLMKVAQAGEANIDDVLMMDLIDLFLGSGANVNAVNKLGMTASMYAAYTNNARALEQLLAHGADTSLQNNDGDNALSLAIKNEASDVLATFGHATISEKMLCSAAQEGDVACVSALISKGIKVNQANKEGLTALVLAALHGHTNVVKLLLAKGADINAFTGDGQTALMSAVHKNHPIVVEHLLQSGADPSIAPHIGGHALHLAKSLGFQKVIKVFQKAGISEKNISEIKVDYIRYNAFCSQMAFEGQIVSPDKQIGPSQIWFETVCPNRITVDGQKFSYTLGDETGAVLQILPSKFQLDAGKRNAAATSKSSLIYITEYFPEEDEAKYSGETLFTAAEKNSLPTMEFLLKKTVNVNKLDKKGQTAMIVAASMGHEDIVKVLFQSGADINVMTPNGDTAMSRAVQKDKPNVVKLLLLQGADPNKLDKKGQTAMIVAAAMGHEDIVKVLFQAGADINAMTPNGHTALFRAVQKDKPNIVKLLLLQGADPTLAAAAGGTPLHLAISFKSKHIIEIFSSAGIKTAKKSARDIALDQNTYAGFRNWKGFVQETRGRPLAHRHIAQFIALGNETNSN